MQFRDVDTITYPDDGVMYVKKAHMAFKVSDALKDWTSNPATDPED